MILGGEKTKVDRFNGGNKSVRTITNDDQSSPQIMTDVTVEVEPPAGHALQVTTITVREDNALTDPDDADELPDRRVVDVWHFNLSQVVRDQDSNAQGRRELTPLTWRLWWTGRFWIMAKANSTSPGL